MSYAKPNPSHAAYQMGEQAYCAGLMHRDCPFAKGTYSKGQWHFGYTAAVERYRALMAKGKTQAENRSH